MYVAYECFVLSNRRLCDEPIPRPEEFYRLWCVIVCNLETSRMRQSWPALGCCAREKKVIFCYLVQVLYGCETWCVILMK
jgi:hypothetical protein